MVEEFCEGTSSCVAVTTPSLAEYWFQPDYKMLKVEKLHVVQYKSVHHITLSVIFPGLLTSGSIIEGKEDWTALFKPSDFFLRYK